MRTYIYIAISVIIIIYIAHREYTISSLEDDVKSLESAVLVASVNYTECDENIAEQNEVISRLALDMHNKTLEFEDYKKLEPIEKVRYEIIYKDVNNSREDRSCEEYEAIERNTYFLDWNK